jgi:hypothetical protein
MDSFPNLDKEQDAFFGWIGDFHVWALTFLWGQQDILKHAKLTQKKLLEPCLLPHMTDEEKAEKAMKMFIDSANPFMVKSEDDGPRSMLVKKGLFSRRYHTGCVPDTSALPDDHYAKILSKEGKFYCPPRVLDPEGNTVNLGTNESALINDGDVCVFSVSPRVYSVPPYGVNAKISSIQPIWFGETKPKKRNIANLVSESFKEDFAKRFKINN